MSDLKPVLDSMTWSFSRITSFGNCPYEWYLNYIEECDDKTSNIYGEFGSFCHSILEQYFNMCLEKEELLAYYIEYFDDFVTRTPWNGSAVDKLFDYGFNYFNEINYNPREMDILGVEQEFEVEVSGHKVKGFIDLIYREGDQIIVCDHKSCEYPFTKKGAIKKGKEEKFESFKKQLYIYSLHIKQEYGIYPIFLEWNFFREGIKHRISFNENEFNDAIEWTKNQIDAIYDVKDFDANPSYFYCNNLCDFRNVCEYRG